MCNPLSGLYILDSVLCTSVCLSSFYISGLYIHPECTIQRDRTKTNTLKYTTQNPECTIQRDIERRQTHRSTLNTIVYFSVFVFVLSLWIVHSGFCVVYFGVFVFVLYLTKTNTLKYTTQNPECTIQRDRTKTNTPKYTTQNPECTIQRYRTKTNSPKYTTQNPEFRSISLDCTFWILCCVLQCVCLHSISLDCV
jgi:hypothetical protein